MSKSNKRMLVVAPVVGIGLALASPAQAAPAQQPLPVAGLANSENWVDHAGASLDGSVHQGSAARLVVSQTFTVPGRGAPQPGVSLADLTPIRRMESVIVDMLRAIVEEQTARVIAAHDDR